MRVRLAPLLFLSAFIFLAAPAFAQDGSLLGSVVDGTKAALPGATITATMIDTGRVSSTVADERGEYRLRGLPAGRYKVQAELSGFSTVIIPDIELLVGQNRSLPFQMQLASLSETLTVTAESPLVDISSTQVAGNVDRRQMEELPLQGRNWMELAMQVKGITANAVDTTPGVRDRAFQLNLDGQEITQQVAGSGFGQPKFSREAIAEFQVVTNLFDITQGRSLGIQVQAISRSGTNNYDGSVYGYFRDDKWNAKDFIANRVLPYANQQIGRQPPQLPQLRIRFPLQIPHILQQPHIQFRHCIQTQQIQPRHAQMHPFDRPIMKPRHPQRAPVTNPARQHLVCVT